MDKAPAVRVAAARDMLDFLEKMETGSRNRVMNRIPEMVHKPLLEPLVSGMLRVFGDKRRRLLTVIPKGWGLVFRDFCEPHMGASSEDRIEVIFDCVTSEVRRYPVYFSMWEGVCLGMLDLTKSGGSLDYQIAADRSRVTAVFSW